MRQVHGRLARLQAQKQLVLNGRFPPAKTSAQKPRGPLGATSQHIACCAPLPSSARSKTKSKTNPKPDPSSPGSHAGPALHPLGAVCPQTPEQFHSSNLSQLGVQAVDTRKLVKLVLITSTTKTSSYFVRHSFRALACNRGQFVVRTPTVVSASMTDCGSGSDYPVCGDVTLIV